MANLVETVLGAFSPNALSQIAALLGEGGATTSRGLATAIPVLLAGAVTKSKSAGGADLLALVQGAISGGNPLDTLGSALASESGRAALMQQGGGISDGLLGSQADTIVNAVAGLVGAKPTSVRSLLAVAGPVALGALAKGAGEPLSAGAVATMLSNGNDSIYRALPEGVRTFFSLEPPASRAAYAEPDPYAAILFPPKDDRKPAGGAVPDSSPAPYVFQPKSYTLAWVMLGAGVLTVLFSMVGRQERVADPLAIVEDAAPAVPAGAGLMSELRDGRPMLIVFFAVAQSDVANELAVESEKLEDYLETHPDARLSVSGYVDPTGDAAFNAELAKSRAQKVAAALAAAGIPADRIDMDKPADIVAGETSYANDRKVEVTIKEGAVAAVVDAVTPDATAAPAEAAAQ